MKRDGSFSYSSSCELVAKNASLLSRVALPVVQHGFLSITFWHEVWVRQRDTELAISTIAAKPDG